MIVLGQALLLEMQGGEDTASPKTPIQREGFLVETIGNYQFRSRAYRTRQPRAIVSLTAGNSSFKAAASASST